MKQRRHQQRRPEAIEPLDGALDHVPAEPDHDDPAPPSLSRTIAIAAANAASGSSAVVSINTASSAARRGAAARYCPAHRAPDLRLHLGTQRDSSRPNSPHRRRARTAASRSRTVSPLASGNTTVPISRPSSTAPARREPPLEIEQRRPHAGMPRPRLEADRPPGRANPPREISARAPRRRLRRRRIRRIAVLVQHPTSDRAIQQPGVEMRHAELAANRRASVPFPAAAGPSIAITRRVIPMAAPRPSISATKPGKLVAMNPDRPPAPAPRRQPEHQRAHRDPMVHLRRDQAAAGRPRRHARSGRRPRSPPERR